MKKLAILMALLFSIAMCAFPSSLLLDKTDNSASSTFVLPASLVTIRDEAFESTAAEVVIMPDSLTVIGERAFAYSRNLKEISIPKSVTYIGDQTFEGVFGLTIRGAENSYAAHWAKAHGIEFAFMETMPAWIKLLGKLLAVNGNAFLTCFCVFPDITLQKRRRMLELWRSMRPQDRPELYPIDYRFP